MTINIETAATWQKLQKLVYKYVTVVAFGTIRKKAEDPECFHAGSGFMISVDNKYLFITADHVVESFLSKKKENSNLHFRIDQKLFIQPEDQIIARCSKPDICTLNITSQQAKIYERCIFTPDIWPPTHSIAEKDNIIIAGFPRSLRNDDDDASRELVFNIWMLSCQVSSISALYFSTHYNSNCWLPNLETSVPENPGELDLGGMSGGPVFLTNIPKNELFIPNKHLIPIGIVYESNRSNDQEGVIKMSKLLFVGKDGRIVVPYLPS